MRMRLALVALLSVTPQLAWAQDAGDLDAGDAGGEVDAGPVPDASAGDETYERCLDGYDRGYLEACAGRDLGASCTFPSGETGACAALRCLDATGRAALICVATTGQPAPPPTASDGGPLPTGGDAGASAEPLVAEGGGCTSAPRMPSSLLLIALGALGVRRAVRAR